MAPVAQFCVCAGSPGSAPQWQESDLFIGGTCGTSIISGTPPAILPGYLSMGLGRWGDPTTYPGVEALRWNIGDYQVVDGCTGITKQEVFTGVTTIGGFPAHTIDASGVGAPMPPLFIDQVNCLDRSGGVRLNVPFWSSRVINLNH